MALDQDSDFMGAAERTEARREARRFSLVGIVVAFILGFGLVSLLLYGRILTDDAAVVSMPPSAVSGPEAPTPTPAPANAP